MKENIENKSFTMKFKIKDITKHWLQTGNYYRAKVYYELNYMDHKIFDVSINADNITELKSLVKQHIRKNLKKIKKLV